ncbi:Major capsid protein Gp5 [uncultured Caudovirales phage]|uniref:Major capsid protein Gp5 n=1 Tax=uncultured Caudovirales phage TaxID=2100421 RepID=A0A6J7WJ46_9CAUD|nr:Major capsid protein Gp5 [uncultured Caudovirales phage]
MANTISNIKDVGATLSTLAAGYLADSNQFIKTIDKEPESSFGSVDGYKKGQTININKPARPSVGITADVTSTLQDFVEETVPLTLSNQYNVPLSFSSKELVTKIDIKMFAERVLKPSMNVLGNKIEADILTAVKNACYNSVGTANATAFDTDTMLSARERLMIGLVPNDGDMYSLLNSTAMRSAVNARKGLPNSQSEIAKQYKNGYIMEADGFTYLENQKLPTHTCGTRAATGATLTTTSVNGATTVAITGTGAQTITAGDVFTIANVFAVDPVTKATLSNLQQFVCTATNTASAGAYTGVAISPTIYDATTGKTLQTVSALPASGAAIVFVGVASTSAVQNFSFHKSAVRLATVPLFEPKGVDMVAQSTVDGLTVRILRDFDPRLDIDIFRADVLWGSAVVRPEWITRVTA